MHAPFSYAFCVRVNIENHLCRSKGAVHFSVRGFRRALFYYTLCFNLNKINIPGNVTSIGESAFNGCENLENIYFDGTKANWESMNVEISKSCTVHCSDGNIGVNQ